MEIYDSRPDDYRQPIMMLTSLLLNLISGYVILISSILILFSFMFPRDVFVPLLFVPKRGVIQFYLASVSLFWSTSMNRQRSKMTVN